MHESRHVGAFSIAYAAALLLVVIRPARARAIFPVTLVLAGALFITAMVDVVEGHVPLVDETAHLPELLSVPLVWLLARPLPDPRRAPTAGRPDGTPLAAPAGTRETPTATPAPDARPAEPRREPGRPLGRPGTRDPDRPLRARPGRGRAAPGEGRLVVPVALLGFALVIGVLLVLPEPSAGPPRCGSPPPPPPPGASATWSRST